METEEILNKINNHEERLKKIEERFFKSGQNAAPVLRSSKEISISEFVSERQPYDDLQRTVIFAYFLGKYEKREFFNSTDIQNCFIRSKSKRPANVNDKINQCIKKGWISENVEKEGGKKTFYLTSKGAEAVENNFKEGKE